MYITNQICNAGGLERVLAIKTAYLIDHFDYDIHILTLNQQSPSLFYPFHPKIQHHNITARGHALGYLIGYITGLNRTIKHIRPDVISVCDDGLKGFWVPLLIQKTVPMVYERHASKQLQQTQDTPSLKNRWATWLKHRLMHWGGALYDKFVVLTPSNLTEWSLPNLTVIGNPLSLHVKAPAPLKNKRVIAVGTQNPQKGYDRLLKSWQLISQQHPDWQLSIYGRIDPTLGLTQLAQELGISNSVSFYPPTKDILEKYLEASVYVMSSRSEGFGMVLIEAMACGLPLVAFDCPSGPKDIIHHKEDGLLVPNHDIAAFAQAVSTLIKNPTTRHAMGARARVNSEAYRPERILPAWDRLFKNLLNPPT